MNVCFRNSVRRGLPLMKSLHTRALSHTTTSETKDNKEKKIQHTHSLLFAPHAQSPSVCIQTSIRHTLSASTPLRKNTTTKKHTTKRSSLLCLRILCVGRLSPAVQKGVTRATKRVRDRRWVLIQHAQIPRAFFTHICGTGHAHLDVRLAPPDCLCAGATPRSQNQESTPPLHPLRHPPRPQRLQHRGNKEECVSASRAFAHRALLFSTRPLVCCQQLHGKPGYSASVFPIPIGLLVPLLECAHSLLRHSLRFLHTFLLVRCVV